MRHALGLLIKSVFMPGLIGMTFFVVMARPIFAESDGTLRARAIVRGSPEAPSIMGVVTFTQRPCPGCLPPPGLGPPATATDPRFADFPEPTVEIVAEIQGLPTELTAGAHGMHIHEIRNCTPLRPGDLVPFIAAGGHFDPGPNGNSQVDDNHPFHMGDIPNLIVDENGNGFMRHITSRITLSPGPLTIFDENGSVVIVHLGPDRGRVVPAFTPVQPVGTSGGRRIACGEIDLVSDEEDDDDDDGGK